MEIGCGYPSHAALSAAAYARTNSSLLRASSFERVKLPVPGSEAADADVGLNGLGVGVRPALTGKRMGVSLDFLFIVEPFKAISDGVSLSGYMRGWCPAPYACALLVLDGRLGDSLHAWRNEMGRLDHTLVAFDAMLRAIGFALQGARTSFGLHRT